MLFANQLCEMYIILPNLEIYSVLTTFYLIISPSYICNCKKNNWLTTIMWTPCKNVQCTWIEQQTKNSQSMSFFSIFRVYWPCTTYNRSTSNWYVTTIKLFVYYIEDCSCSWQVLTEAFRVLKPGGRFMCLEFSQVNNLGLRRYLLSW